MLEPTQVCVLTRNTTFFRDYLHHLEIVPLDMHPVSAAEYADPGIFFERGHNHDYHDCLHAKMVVPGGFRPLDISGYFIRVSHHKHFVFPASFGYQCSASGTYSYSSKGWFGFIPRPNCFIGFRIDQLASSTDVNGRWGRAGRKNDPYYGQYYTELWWRLYVRLPDAITCTCHFGYRIGEDHTLWEDPSSYYCSYHNPPNGVSDSFSESLFRAGFIAARDSIIRRADAAINKDRDAEEPYVLSIFDDLASAVNGSQFLHFAVSKVLPDVYYTQEISNYRVIKTLSPLDQDAPRFSNILLFNEDHWLINHEDSLLLGKQGGDENYFVNNLKQHAFFDAVNNMPRLNDNSLSNIKEIGSFIYNLVTKHRVEIPKSLSSAWLAYRYQYQTTKLDLEEAISFVNRHANLGDLRGGITTYGQYTDYFKGVPVQSRCQIKCRRRELSFMKSLLLDLDTLGLTPDFYVIWDSIPYSFIVDWFLPVGDILSVVDAQRTYSEENFDYSLIGYSMKYLNYDTPNGAYSVYARWIETHPPELNSLYWFEKPSPSDTVVGFRAIDTASLIIGRFS